MVFSCSSTTPTAAWSSFWTSASWIFFSFSSRRYWSRMSPVSLCILNSFSSSWASSDNSSSFDRRRVTSCSSLWFSFTFSLSATRFAAVD